MGCLCPPCLAPAGTSTNDEGQRHCPCAAAPGLRLAREERLPLARRPGIVEPLPHRNKCSLVDAELLLDQRR